MEVKQEPHEIFMEEFRVEEPIFPNKTSKEDNEMDNQAYVIKNDLISIKEEHDPKLYADYLQETYLKTENTSNIGDDETMKDNSIQLKCRNSSRKGHLLRRNYSKYWSLQRGILICRLCGNMYTKRFEIVIHVSRHLAKTNRYIFKSSNLEAIKQNFNYELECKFGQEIKKGKQDKCDIGLKSFKQPSNVYIQNPTRVNTFKCETCSRSYSNNKSFSRHMRIHTTDNPFKCNYCSEFFTERYRLVQHIHIHTGEKPFECEICLKCFSNQGNLKRHMLVHTGDKSFKCEFCSKSFTQKNSLKYHISVHTDEKQFKCDICFKSFRDKSNLVQHKRIHEADNPLKCQVCSKSFIVKYKLVKHMKTHLVEKQFKCSICPKSFSEEYQLVNHINTHTNGKQFKCDICLKSFSQPNSLKRHMQVHTGGSSFKCEFCSKSFTRKTNLNYHMKYRCAAVQLV